MKFLFFILSCIFAKSIIAGPIVDIDIYGVDSKQAETILNRYKSQIFEVETAMQNAIQSSVKSALNSKTFDPTKIKPAKGYALLKKNRQSLLDKIKNEQDLLSVDASTIFYMPMNTSYTTLEVVPKSRPELLKFASKTVTKPRKRTSDIIDKMDEFSELVLMLYSHKLISKKDFDTRQCPIYHCVVNFFHPRLKPYLAIFNEKATKEKSFILKTLKEDKNSDRRGAAVFLLGHLKNPEEIILQLLPYVQDADSLVRNNSIRVIGETIKRSKIYDINLDPFLALLHSPVTLDRNKSLIVIYEAAQSLKAKNKIIADGGDSLLKLLQLKQPNNHEWAYKILKRLSNKNWGDRDYTSWKKWLESAKNMG